MDTDPMEPFTDAEDEEEVDVELDVWEDSEEGMENLGLSDGDSMSEGDLAVVSGDEGVSLDNGQYSYTWLSPYTLISPHSPSAQRGGK